MQFAELNKYKTKGEFIFRNGNRLSEFCKSVPHAAGVYLFRTIKGGKETLVYIGASGTMKQNGNFGAQLLKKRLQNKQNKKTKRLVYFQTAVEVTGLEGIKVYWYVTFDEQHQDLPMYVEGLLIQKYFDMHKVLPIWNDEF